MSSLLQKLFRQVLNGLLKSNKSIAHFQILKRSLPYKYSNQGYNVFNATGMEYGQQKLDPEEQMFIARQSPKL